MKTVQKTGLALLILISLYLLSGWFAKSVYQIQRTHTMQAPPNLIFDQVAVLRNWEQWSPWKEKDPGAQFRYEGEDGKAGSILSWSGDQERSGTGQIRIESLTKPYVLNYVLQFSEPYKLHAKGSFVFTQLEADKTAVKWVDEGDIPYLMRPLLMFMDIDVMLGPDFERGLFKIDSISRLIYREKLKADSLNAISIPDPPVMNQ